MDPELSVLIRPVGMVNATPDEYTKTALKVHVLVNR